MPIDYNDIRDKAKQEKLYSLHTENSDYNQSKTDLLGRKIKNYHNLRLKTNRKNEAKSAIYCKEYVVIFGAFHIYSWRILAFIVGKLRKLYPFYSINTSVIKIALIFLMRILTNFLAITISLIIKISWKLVNVCAENFFQGISIRISNFLGFQQENEKQIENSNNNQNSNSNSDEKILGNFKFLEFI